MNEDSQEPDLKDFLAGAGLNAAELTEVICTDQRQRWLHGERPEVEAYIALHGSFYPGAEPGIDLVFGEFLARRELGESPTLDEYCSRFPELAGQLRLHVGLHDALGEVAPARGDPAFGPGEDPSTIFRAAQTAVAGSSEEMKKNRLPLIPRPSSFIPSDELAFFPEFPGYEILGEAGRGGMGIVYKAHQLSLQRVVAIKVVPFGGDEQIAARFRREFHLAGRLAHPNLVAAYDAGTVAGLPYFVMEFVEGIGLDALIRKRGPLPVAEACEVVCQAALGLQHIHEHGLVHRDVKPSNLMLTLAGQVKLLDLGLARLAHESSQEGRITSTRQFLGTLDYMAPEQCDDIHTVDVRADIYSLGCTLYHLLAGDPPFAAFSSPYQKLRAQMETPAPPLCEQRSDVPGLLNAALVRMLAKDRNDRFTRPTDIIAAVHPFAFGADLPRLLPTNPVSALPYSVSGVFSNLCAVSGQTAFRKVGSNSGRVSAPQARRREAEMNDPQIRAAVERHWAASAAGNQNAEHEIYHDDVILDYPQSGERIRGRHNVQAQRSEHPDRPSGFVVRRIIGAGDLWVSECVITYSGRPYNTVSIMEFQGDKVVRETQYFAEAFEPAAWRAQWVEVMK